MNICVIASYTTGTQKDIYRQIQQYDYRIDNKPYL